jgi:hypothetical protein
VFGPFRLLPGQGLGILLPDLIFVGRRDVSATQQTKQSDASFFRLLVAAAPSVADAALNPSSKAAMNRQGDPLRPRRRASLPRQAKQSQDRADQPNEDHEHFQPLLDC